MFEKRKADKELIYKTVDGVGLPMNVYLPKDLKDKNRAVLCIHGGGWKGAIKDNAPWDGSWMSNHAQYYAQRGVVGISISYRDLDLRAGLTAKDQIEDCKDALIFIKEMLPYVDFENLMAIGDSAGAHLALCLGFLPQEDLRPSKIVACNPVTDLVNEKWAYTAKTEVARREISPLFMIDDIDFSNTKKPEILCMHGDKDTVVPIETTLEFKEKLTLKGFKTEMITIPDASHAFILWGYTAKEEDVFECMEKTNEFFGI